MKVRLWRYEMTVTLRKREPDWSGREIHIGAEEPMFSRDAIALAEAIGSAGTPVTDAHMQAARWYVWEQRNE